MIERSRLIRDLIPFLFRTKSTLSKFLFFISGKWSKMKKIEIIKDDCKRKSIVVFDSKFANTENFFDFVIPNNSSSPDVVRISDKTLPK